MRLFKNCSSVTCVRCAIVKHGYTNADIIDGKPAIVKGEQTNTTKVQSVLRRNE